ncbi:MAG: hypothetical protein K9G67_08745 [Bacteroidales bacterium]|nr:hypothetical protein [Bacteroidales bacterium]MCF8343262.1 hypothetical protein [Bacteroidales bacterium]MCF8351298.1 hypothetical protein [Bacteroidales bacterium]MCF8376428.1 hypothetical protein [Bacteroidales bacterium]MCF8400547.1 hypothetical protein [Bacteroidales bacterium]
MIKFTLFFLISIIPCWMMAFTGEIIKTFDTPGDFTTGMTFDGTHLWLADRKTEKLYCINPADGKVVREISSPAYWHMGLAWDGETLWNADVQGGILLSENYNGKIYRIDPENVGSMDEIPKEIKDIFLENNEKYRYDHPVIQNAVKEAVGDEKNPYWIARKIYNYLMDKMYYEMVGGWNTAPTVLARGNGSCSEYSFVYISLCRAAGLPARYVGSVVVRGDYATMDDVYHRWVEVYLPGYGWIPVDPSGGDHDSPRRQAHFFGQLANRFLITTESGGGSETMTWTYNSNEFFTTEPKTNVAIDHFADWEPLEE